jgi:hypothetical protein
MKKFRMIMFFLGLSAVGLRADFFGTLQKGFQALPVVKKYWQCLIGKAQCSPQELAQAKHWLFNTPDATIAHEVFITTGTTIGSRAIQDVRNKHRGSSQKGSLQKGLITPIKTRS